MRDRMRVYRGREGRVLCGRGDGGVEAGAGLQPGGRCCW